MLRALLKGCGGREGLVAVAAVCSLFLQSVSFDNLGLHRCVVSVVPLAPVFCFLQLSATDVSARTTMKGAAKCDKHCELQNSVNQ